MVDFVLGKRLLPPENGNVVEILSPSSPTDVEDNNDGGQGKERIESDVAESNTTITTTTNADMAVAPNISDAAKENAPNGPEGITAAPVTKNPYGKLSFPHSTTQGGGSGRGIGTSSSNGQVAVESQHGQSHSIQHGGIGPRLAAEANDRSKEIQQQRHTSAFDATGSKGASSSAGRDPSSATAAPFNASSFQNQSFQQQQQQPQQQQQQPNKQAHTFFDGKSWSKKRSRLSEPRDRHPFHEGPVPLNMDLAKTYIYPKHDQYQTRDYQVEMTETALNYNTLVSLPTGLGKTHIAAVVMYNFYRWFATGGKIIFLAPTLPLVNQQVEACYKIMGIPAKDTAVMTGRTNAETRNQWWAEKRLFFCTPQTVQKDLQAQMAKANETGEPSLSSFASQVVCLVLDEAHKASGEYAYTKVIQLLDNAGAKYRIVGLSATPGTTLKAVQSVIDALNIVKVAARTEEDPTVACYLHQKKTEIIVCERSTHQRDVERMLSDIVGPLLETLRQEGGLSYVGNGSLSAYTIHTARAKFAKERAGPTNGYLMTVFNAVYHLVAIRSHCNQSLGVVKKKLQDLKNTPQRGVLSTIVKSEAFEEVFQTVVAATEGSTGSAIAPTKDPKIAKLCQILEQHFILADDAGTSSRVIIFAQFRDFVGEIVDTLELYKPMIRARYFVGQGKGSGGTKADSSVNQDGRVAGMKQADQQKTIRQFRENIFNVLVCTSIGEEGLDIGEVDLIVNYDVLSSPTRSIQRAGRTGRKRNGRIITLIAEGQEEQRYKKQVQDERTLTNALRDPKRFTVHAHVPMLPSIPSQDFRKMDISSQLHMSQVVGAHKTPTTGKRRSSGGGAAGTDWRLDPAEEEERKQFCRDPASLPSSTTWNAFIKHLFKFYCDPYGATTFDHPSRPEKKRKELAGRNRSILKCLAEHGPTHAGGIARGNVSLRKIFPSGPVFEDGAIVASVDSPKLSEVRKNLLVASNKAPTNEESHSLPLLETNITEHEQSVVSKVGNEQLPLTPLASETHDANGGFIGGECTDGFRMPTPPPSSSSSDDDSDDDAPIPQPAAFQDQSRVSANGLCIDNNREGDRDFVAHSHVDQMKNDAQIGDFALMGRTIMSPTKTISEGTAADAAIGTTTSCIGMANTPTFVRDTSSSEDKKVSSKTPPQVAFEASQDSEIGHIPRARKSRALAIADSDDEPSVSSALSQPKDADKKVEKITSMGSNSLTNTPEDRSRLSQKRPGTDFLTDTPVANDAEEQEIICLVCGYDDSVDGNRIVLCDACNAGFHQRCYSIPEEIVESDKPWFCDVCIHRSVGSPLSSFEARCAYCSQPGGAMKNTDMGWCHSICKLFESKICPSECSSCSKKGSVQCEKCSKATHPFCGLSTGWMIAVNGATNGDSNPKLYCPSHLPSHDNGLRILPKASRSNKKGLKRLKRASDDYEDMASTGSNQSQLSNVGNTDRARRRREVMARFVLEEANIASDQDEDGDSAEEEEARRIEQEEGLSQDSFINDNPSLTQHFSQDELAEVDPDAAEDGESEDRFDYSHRALDAQRDAQSLFSTPFFNRRMRQPESDTSSVPASQRGLGQMNFIRSVLDHHRQGGDADEIEQMYQQLEQEGSPDASSPGSVQTSREEASPSTTLTIVQRARAEANRQAALQRRLQNQHDSTSRQN